MIEEKCRAKVGNGLIEFCLMKKDEGLWGQIGSSTIDKDEMKRRRDEAVLASHQREKELVEKRAKAKKQEETFAIREQMKIEQEKRDRIEKVKKVSD